MTTGLPFSQAAQNNRAPILAVLRESLKGDETVLEIGSGTGQHAVFFAAQMPDVTWQPSEQQGNLAMLNLRLEAEAPKNVRVPVALDVADDPWKLGAVSPIDVVYAANCIHIMSWGHVEMMFAGMGKLLAPDGLLVLYGPFKYDGAFTSDSNANFEQWLKGNNIVSGIRDFEKVDALANAIGLFAQQDHQMPANNQCIIWQKKS